VNLYGLIIGISLIIGIEYFSKHSHFLSTKQQNIFLIGLLVSMLIGARAYHVIDQWQFYSQNLWLIPQTWRGGLGIYGALILGTIFTYLYSKFNKISFLKILDSVTPILPLCQAIGRFGNFFNHEIPSWWLEASLNLFLFFLLKKSKNPTAHYLIGYGLIRFFLEFFRNDTWQINHLKIAQLMSLISILIGLFLLKATHKGNNLLK
jgi:phosphatidylglycerol:prolipoprotein diacylglycerol transferase